MKYAFLLFSFFLLILSPRCYSQGCTTEYLQHYSEYKREYLDSGLIITTVPPLEAKRFYVYFKSACFNRAKSTIEIEGKVSYDKKNNHGISGVTIFLGSRNLNALSDTFHLVESSYILNPKTDTGGLFRISFKIEPNTRLFFHKEFNFLEEYNIGKLLKK